jgi:hypothetical protein
MILGEEQFVVWKLEKRIGIYQELVYATSFGT